MATNGPITQLTPADRLEIHQLIAAYGFYEDTGDAEGYASCFTSDGGFFGRGKDPVVGRDKLIEFMKWRWEQALFHARAHFMVNTVIVGTPEGAQATSYRVQIDRDGEEFKVAGMSKRLDELRRENGKWLFYRRRSIGRPGEPDKV
jgi:uncharacterized protein (TIGR02246 family)